MKTIFSILLLICIAGLGCKESQKQIDVPAPVLAKYKSQYPDVKKVTWEMEDGRYEAAFEGQSGEMAVQYSTDGMLVLTETEIEISALPKTVTDYFNQNKPGKKLSDPEKIVTADGAITFEVEVDNTDYLFDSAGNYTGMEKEESEEKEED